MYEVPVSGLALSETNNAGLVDVATQPQFGRANKVYIPGEHSLFEWISWFTSRTCTVQTIIRGLRCFATYTNPNPKHDAAEHTCMCAEVQCLHMHICIVNYMYTLSETDLNRYMY
jgi:hypothetical protein